MNTPFFDMQIEALEIKEREHRINDVEFSQLLEYRRIKKVYNSKINEFFLESNSNKSPCIKCDFEHIDNFTDRMKCKKCGKRI